MLKATEDAKEKKKTEEICTKGKVLTLGNQGSGLKVVLAILCRVNKLK